MTDVTVEDVLRESSKLLSAGKHNEAIELMTNALANSIDARIYFERGRHFDLIGKPEHAVADVTKALQLDPENAEYYLCRGKIFAETLQRPQHAVDDFEKTLEFAPENAEAHRQSCLCLILLGKPIRAFEHAQAAARLSPSEAITYFCVGQSQLSLNQFDDAAQSFAQAVNLEPHLSHYWASLGRARGQAGQAADLEEAIAAYSKAIELKPECASYFQSRGKLHLKLGNVANAIVDLRHALTLNPCEATMILINHYLKKSERLSQ